MSDATPETVSEDEVYGQLAASLRKMKQPLSELMATHDQFVLQNISIMNDVKNLKHVRRQCEKAVERESEAVSETGRNS